MFQHLSGITLRGALVLLLVCTLSWPAFAGAKAQPVATSVSAYTSRFRSPLVETVIVERELRGPQDMSARMKVALLAPARERSKLADNSLMLELTPAADAAPKPGQIGRAHV